jgi:hypothetical protein
MWFAETIADFWYNMKPIQVICKQIHSNFNAKYAIDITINLLPYSTTFERQVTLRDK